MPAGEIRDRDVGDDWLVGDVLQPREFQLDLDLGEGGARCQAKTNQRPAQLHQNVNYRKPARLHRKVAKQIGGSTWLWFLAAASKSPAPPTPSQLLSFLP